MRKVLQVLTMVVMSSVSLSALALGVGEVQVNSHLNQPFSATIPLIGAEGLSADDLAVQIASEADFQRMGITRDFVLTQLRFEVKVAESTVIVISSDKPIREPFLNFILDVQSPKAQLLKEFTVLLDLAP